jgi:hypothetical protein
MPRRKAAQNCNIRPWLSASADCKEKIFTMIGNSLLLSETFQKLTPGAKMLYITMTLQSAGRRDFEFPNATAHRYGFADKSFRRYVAELAAAGFITVVSGRTVRQPNLYSFSLEWKQRRPP